MGKIIPRTQTRLLDKWIMPIILLLGLGLRLLFIASRGIWYDDAFSILLARQPLGSIIQGTAADTMPPLYYFLLHGWILIGDQIWLMRMLNITISLIVIWMVYKFTFELYDQKAGFIAAFLTAISPFQIYHAQELRMYALLELGLLGYLWFSWRLSKPGQLKLVNFLPIIGFGLVAMYTHNLAIFTISVPILYYLVKRDWKLLRASIMSFISIVILFLPWIMFVPGQISKIQTAFWTPKPGVIEVLQAVDTLFGSLPQPQAFMVIITMLSVWLVVLLVIDVRRAKNSIPLSYLVFAVLIPPVLLFVVSYLMRPVFVTRAFIASGLIIYIMVAIITSHKPAGGNPRKPAKWILVGVLSLLALVSLPYQYMYNSFPRSEFKSLAQEMGKVCVEDCVVIHDNKLSYFPTYIYAPNLSQRFVSDTAGSHNDTLAAASLSAMQLTTYSSAMDAAENFQKIYFVTFEKTLLEYQQMGKKAHPSVELLSQKYSFVGNVNLGDLVIFEFTK